MRRLRILLNALAEDDEDDEDGGEIDPNEYPGMAGLARALVDDKHLNHKDKEVRLYTVLACVELFYLVSSTAVIEAQMDWGDNGTKSRYTMTAVPSFIVMIQK